MAIGERIRYLRNLRGMTMKYLGMLVGFDEKTADVRIAQYESGTRTPKEELTAAIAKALEVSPQALNIPYIDSYMGLIHTLFALEDIYGLGIDNIDGEICITLDKSKRMTFVNLFDMFHAWQQKKEQLEKGQITKEEYDDWRYNYPTAEGR